MYTAYQEELAQSGAAGMAQTNAKKLVVKNTMKSYDKLEKEI